MASSPKEPDSICRSAPIPSVFEVSQGRLRLFGNILFVLAFVPNVIIFYELLRLNDETDLASLWSRFRFYAITGLCLGAVSAILIGITKYRLLRRAASKQD